jgi:hypothetical protein
VNIKAKTTTNGTPSHHRITGICVSMSGDPAGSIAKETFWPRLSSVDVAESGLCGVAKHVTKGACTGPAPQLGAPIERSGLVFGDELAQALPSMLITRTCLMACPPSSSASDGVAAAATAALLAEFFERLGTL